MGLTEGGGSMIMFLSDIFHYDLLQGCSGSWVRLAFPRVMVVAAWFDIFFIFSEFLCEACYRKDVNGDSGSDSGQALIYILYF